MQASRKTVEQSTDALLAVLLGFGKTTQREAMRVAAEHDLTITQLRILHAVDHQLASSPSVGGLAEVIGLSVAATGRAIDGLVRAGLLTRTEAAEDRRVKVIGLGDAGVRLLTRITDVRRASVADFIASLSDDERERLDAAVGVLADLTGPHDAPCATPHSASTSREDA